VDFRSLEKIPPKDVSKMPRYVCCFVLSLPCKLFQNLKSEGPWSERLCGKQSLVYAPKQYKIYVNSLSVIFQVGRKVMVAAAESNLKKVSLELGGKSPNIIFPDVNSKYTVWPTTGPSTRAYIRKAVGNSRLVQKFVRIASVGCHETKWKGGTTSHECVFGIVYM
jgi:hypothetical protein